MRDVLKHVKWSIENEERVRKGLIAVYYDLSPTKNFVVVKELAGSLPANYLVDILDITLPEWREIAEQLHRSRKHPWRVEMRECMWGSRTIFLRILRDSVLCDAPVACQIHVTVSGKLSGEKICAWLGDLPPILCKLMQYYPKTVTINLEAYEPSLELNFRGPGEPSGFIL
jgi:hypothetical protein